MKDFINKVGIKNYPAYEIIEDENNSNIISLCKVYHMNSGCKLIEEEIKISKDDFEKMLYNWKNK